MIKQIGAVAGLAVIGAIVPKTLPFIAIFLLALLGLYFAVRAVVALVKFVFNAVKYLVYGTVASGVILLAVYGLYSIVIAQV